MSFHAHIYFSLETKSVANFVREEFLKNILDECTGVGVGVLHDHPIGPHLQPQFAIYFSLATFNLIVPWLMLHRAELPVLIHPETGDDLLDHTEYPLWMGKILPLDLARL